MSFKELFTDVVIVGAGPTGLALALGLQRGNPDIKVIILDQNKDRVQESRALIVHSRTIEIFDKLGIAEKAVELGHQAKGVRFYLNLKYITSLDVSGTFLNSQYPFPLILEQYHVEDLMQNTLRQRGLHVWRRMLAFAFEGEGFISSDEDTNEKEQNYDEKSRFDAHDLSGITSIPGLEKSCIQGDANLADYPMKTYVKKLSSEVIDDDYKRKTLRKGDEDLIIHSKIIVGCDGARSLVRKSSGINFSGSRSNTEFVVADVFVDWPLKEYKQWIQVNLSPEAFLGCFPYHNGSWRIIYSRKSLHHDDEAVEYSADHDASEVERIINKLIPGSNVGSIAWKNVFKISHKTSDKLMSGRRVFLAGDAAHIHPPALAQGMNLGIHDSFNLAWKLVLAISGNAPLSFLESYNAERHPLDVRIASLTAKIFNFILNKEGLPNWKFRFFISHIFPIVKHLGVSVTLARIVSMLDHSYLPLESDALASGLKKRNGKLSLGHRISDIAVIPVNGSVDFQEENSVLLLKSSPFSAHTLLVILRATSEGRLPIQFFKNFGGLISCIVSACKNTSVGKLLCLKFLVLKQNSHPLTSDSAELMALQKYLSKQKSEKVNIELFYDFFGEALRKWSVYLKEPGKPSKRASTWPSSGFCILVRPDNYVADIANYDSSFLPLKLWMTNYLGRIYA